jgi:hypothetical protein
VDDGKLAQASDDKPTIRIAATATKAGIGA